MTRPNFDWFAPHYAWVEAVTFGGLLNWCRTALIGELARAERVLVLGEGDGRFLAAFLAANRVAVVDVVDASPGMVALARRRVAGLTSDRVRWHVADARQFDPPAGRYDLIVTNFFLDCFPTADLGPLVARLARGLAPAGWWVVGDFAAPVGWAARAAAYPALVAMYAFFHLATRIPAYRLVDPEPLLRAQGFTREREELRLGGFLRASLWRGP
ncbi:MAG TPA: class I SAM-dependent methyltransferase [Urbifossiella sp.]|nr:class I SAM-dependent methyltransferase [Urbifossiella sp.]